MKLIEFIKKHYNGVVLQFANANKRTRQQFEQNIESGRFHVIRVDDKLKLMQEKMTIAEPEGEQEK